MFTEVRDTHNGKKVWRNCDNFRLNEYYEEGNEDGETKYKVQPIYHDRDYELFSVLAGVRKYNDKNVPISLPRGLPRDASDVVKAESMNWGVDGHSHSYLSYAEIEDYKKDVGQVVHSGLVSAEDAIKLEKDGILPTEWCQGSSDKTKVWVEWKEPFVRLDELLEKMEERMRDELWIWKDKEITPEQKNDFRVVFWFDN